jgi:hypothetical protein
VSKLKSLCAALALSAACLSIGACSTTARQVYPNPPEELMRPPAALQPLPQGTPDGSIEADKALATVTNNYATARDNADRLEKLQRWLKELTQ